MAAIKALERISPKWVRNAGAGAASYDEGVTNPQGNYEQASLAAVTAFNAGIQVRRAGNAKWQRGAKTKGVVRFAPGVAAAEPDYTAGFAPYHAAIQAVQLPVRGPRRSPQNLQRVSAITTALGARKEALLRGGRS